MFAIQNVNFSVASGITAPKYRVCLGIAFIGNDSVHDK
jgi:hypothetical protein